MDPAPLASPARASPPIAQVLASLHALLLGARHRPANAVAHGARVVEALCRLHASKGGLELGHFADVVSIVAPVCFVLHTCIETHTPASPEPVPPHTAAPLRCPSTPPCPPCPAPTAPQAEALAQLRCIDGLSAAPVVSLAADRARTLDAAAGGLGALVLTQLARVMSAVAAVAGACGAQEPCAFARVSLPRVGQGGSGDGCTLHNAVQAAL